MKVGTYTRLTVLFASLWTSAACGSRTSLMQDADAGVVTDDEGAQSTSSTSGRGGSTGTPGRTVTRAGAGGASGAAARMGLGRGGRSGRAGEDGQGRGGSGGRPDPEERDAAADSGDGESNESAGSGGENAEQSGAGGEQAGAGGESGGSAGESGAPAAGSGGAGGTEGGVAGAPPAEMPRLTRITPEQTTEICGRIDAATMNLAWGDGLRGYCARLGLAQPDMCAAVRDMCISGPDPVPACETTIPECPNIFIEEYVACRIAVLTSFVEYNRTISCEAPPAMPEAALSACTGAYERCPPMVMLAL